MNYYLIVGEASGDLHASNLMRGLLEADEQATFRYYGGDLMAAVGGELARHYKETAVMGVWDVLTHLGKIGRNFRDCKRDILDHRPDALILVDYPGFNLPMAEWAHQQGIPTLYYIAPKVWASKEWRLRRMKQCIDRLYCIMPFERAYFAHHGLTRFAFCGNPVVDALEQRAHAHETTAEMCERLGLDTRPKIALLPGSRSAELRYNLPEMLRLPPLFPDYEFVVAGAGDFAAADYQPYLKRAGCFPKVLFGETYTLLSHAAAAVVTSGTATLETALLACPQVVIYRMWGGLVSDAVAHLFIKVPWIGLVNLILQREAVTELFQRHYTFERLLEELRPLLGPTQRRATLMGDYDELRRLVGPAGASRRAAKDMVSFLKDPTQATGNARKQAT